MQRLSRFAVVTLVVVVAIAAVASWLIIRATVRPTPQCTLTQIDGVSLGVEQADNAATIAGVGLALGMPDHAVTVALATAMQESGLHNLPGGDRDSAGLFQQRPSQGWGTYAEVTDPVTASRAFYDHLHRLPNWQTVTVAEAAQAVQRSANPDAYDQWEPLARAAAIALTGEQPAALTCAGLRPATPATDVAALAQRELGTTQLSGPQPSTQGWAMASWLVAHAQRLGVERVHYDDRTWTADSGRWTTDGRADGRLSLDRRAS